MGNSISIKGLIKEIKNAPIGLKLSTLLVWCLLMAGYPFVFTYMIGYPSLLIIVLFFILMLLCCLIKQKLKSPKIELGLCIMWLFFFSQFLFRGTMSSINSMVQIIIVGVLFLFIENYISLITMIKQYILVIATIVLFAFLGGVLEFITGAQPFFYYTAHNGKPVAVFLFTVCNSGIDFVSHPIIRSSGIFDEPGTLAFFTMIALLLNAIYLKNNTIEKILLFLPITTFSVAHIMTFVLYLLLFKIKKRKQIVLYTLLAGLIYYGVNLAKDTEYHRIYQITVARFDKEDGEFKGNSRAELSHKAQKAFNENILFGIGASEEGDDSMATNPFTLLAYYGIVGYFFVMIFFWDGLFHCLCLPPSQYKYDCLKCLIILFANFQQRPFGTNIVVFMSVLLLIIYIKRGLKYKQIT